MSHRTLYRDRAGFTLIEILIVVVILGILAAIVIPQIAGMSEEARRSSFAASVKKFAEAVERFRIENGTYPEDASSGVIPAGFDEYILQSNYERPTPLGGVWDTELNSMGVTSAIGVHFNDGSDPGAAYMTQVDAIIDDGDLATGAFRELQATRYYWVLAD